jgi:hypothetical protein
MSYIAKKSKKVKLSRLRPDDCLQRLFFKFILYLRGEEMVSDNGEKFDLETEYFDDGTFKPSESDIAAVFKYLDWHWQRYVKKTYKKETWDKYLDLFKKAVSDEWKASKITPEEESQS